jgi:zona occludens toxin
MISLYTGSVGSGKSYHSIELGLQWAKNPKKAVIANFPIKPPKKFLTKRSEKKWEQTMERWNYREEISVEYLMALSFEKGWFGKESSCIVLIDEAGIMFNSRDWQHERKERQKWIKFLSQSRKFGYDFIFICQMDRMIDRQIRGLVEYEVKHLKANNAIFFKWLSMFKVTMFMYVYKWYQTKLKGNMRLSIYRPGIANRYDTMKIFNLEELIESMQKVYDGKVVPAAIASQMEVWKEELNEVMKKRQQENKEYKEKVLKDGTNN